jgi:LuxR family maltose regulon positive regulatory protein
MPQSSSSPLLATKLFVPRPRQAIVPRPGLLRLLDGAITQPLTLVSAPAGFGKTTLVATWVQQQPLPAAWLSLDAADNDPNRFLRYFTAALQSVNAGGRELGEAAAAGQAPPLEAAIVLLINEISALSADIMLVLDDFHVVDEPRIEEALRTLVAHQPPQLHLLLATREDPQLPLARLRGQGQLIELRAQDLRFTPEETATFLQEVMGLRLLPSEVAELDARIEGWVAGLQLAGLSLQKSDDRTRLIAGLASGHHYILGYLTEEVLRQQPLHMQEFLLQTSILESLCAPLCDTVCLRDDSDTLLESLYAANAFVIPLDGEHIWFRYHHLFRELLRSQLQRQQPQNVADLHRRAAGWYAQKQQGVEAIEHALAAADYALTIGLLEAHARPLVLQGYAQTVSGWLQRLPSEWQAAGPRANVAFAWSLLLSGRLGEIEQFLRNAEEALANCRDAQTATGGTADENPRGTQAEILALRAAIVSLRGDPVRACAMARQAVGLAPPDDVYAQGATRFCLATALNYAGRTAEAVDTYREALPLCRAAGNTVAAMLIVANLAMLTIERGELPAAAELCREVIVEAERRGALHSPTLASVLGAYAQVRYEWNELPEALAAAQKALELGRRSGHSAAVAYGSVVLSRLQLAAGDLEAAKATLEEAKQMRQRGMPAWVGPYIVEQQVLVALAQGDEESARQALAESGVRRDDPTNHSLEVLHLAYLHLDVWMLQHNPRGSTTQGKGDGRAAVQIGQLAGKIVTSAEAGGRVGRVIQALVLRSMALNALGDVAGAKTEFGRAITLAAPGGYVRVFSRLGEPMAHLLAIVGAQPAEQAYVQRLRAAAALAAITPKSTARGVAGGQPDGGKRALVEPLSDREIAVLKLLADGLTYGEVAERLIVSLNTVRFHVKSIYGKLGVDNKTAALDAARKLQLW